MEDDHPVEEWNNYKNPFSGMDKYGKPRMELAVFLRDVVFKKLSREITWIIETGTLLGAWRNGKFIPHDDDFDIAVLFEEDAKNQLIRLAGEIEGLLPGTRYSLRVISSYTQKIEVFEPSYGTYVVKDPQCGGYRHHHVTVDLQAYERLGSCYRSLYKNHPFPLDYQCDHLFPIQSIVLEGERFPSPNDPEAALKGIYIMAAYLPVQNTIKLKDCM